MMEEVVKVASETHLSKVLLVRKGSNRTVIWKEVYDPRIFRAEVRALKILKNRDDIVRFHKKVRVGNTKFIQMEYVDGQTLEEIVFKGGPLPEPEAKKIFRQLSLALLYCHQHGVYHRDIKLGNVMVTYTKSTDPSITPSLKGEPHIKLIDFGVSCFGSRDTTFTKARGTREYVAPEMIVKKPYCASKTDIYSLGMLLYELLTGELPFSLNERVHAILEGGEHPPLIFPEKKKLSDEVQDLITKMLALSPSERYDIEDVVSHSWLEIADLERLIPQPTPKKEKKKGIFDSIFSKSSTKRSDLC
eukprot:TRINITY_DN1906_c0_g1_i1.p1 TRINITY_DN1906_c0_g1~~TRINITY_DN1906_c0_g1_i1.p1  ORF type:complete len:303 (-),score=50.26 TRINITY_DN1906_c0_g1_i1:89-997(-)